MRVLRTAWWLQAQLAVVVTVALLGVLAALTVQPARPAGDDVLRLVGSASSAAAEAGSYRMEMELGVDGSGLDVSVTGTAEVDVATGDGSGTMTLPGGRELSFLTTGGRGYFALPQASPMRLGGKEWVSFPLPADQPVTEDPLLFLHLLSGDGEVREVGRDEVRGVETTHYRAQIGRDGVQSLVQKQRSAVLPAQALELISGGSADVWLSDDGLPRRLRVALDADRMQVTFAFELFEYGADVRVAAPPVPSVIDVETHDEAQRLLG